jgi:hypothetical protein
MAPRKKKAAVSSDDDDDYAEPIPPVASTSKRAKTSSARAKTFTSTSHAPAIALMHHVLADRENFEVPSGEDEMRPAFGAASSVCTRPREQIQERRYRSFYSCSCDKVEGQDQLGSGKAETRLCQPNHQADEGMSRLDLATYTLLAN